MKKFFYVLLSLLLLLISIIIIIIVVQIVKNNMILNSFSKQINNCPLPDRTKLIECIDTYGKLNGNGNGNGNGIDYFACILLKSELSYKELKKYYSKIKFKPANNESKSHIYPEIFEVNNIKIESECIENKNLTFKSLKKIKNFQGYYYIIIYDGGYSAGFDFKR